MAEDRLLQIKDANSTYGNNTSSCLIYEEFNWIVGTAASTEHDNMVSGDSALTNPPLLHRHHQRIAN